MACSTRLYHHTLATGAGVSGGALFTWVVGDIDAAHYAVELLSIAPFEIPFIVLGAVLVKKCSWNMGLIYSVFGTLVSLFMFYPDWSITPVIFLKLALMGIILGEPRWFNRNYSLRLTAVAVPGLILAVAFGLPLILRGVAADVMNDIKQESLEMYQAFMSKDDAANAVENAMHLFKFFFQASMGIMFLGSLVLSWLSFHVTRWVMVKIREEPESVPPLYLFKVPFHAIWIFLIGLGIYLIGFKPLFPVAVNVLFIMAGLYGIQGLSIVTYFMNRISMGLLPRVLFWLIFFVTITFSFVILIFAGIIDNWFNLRSLPFSSQTDGQKEDNKNESDS